MSVMPDIVGVVPVGRFRRRARGYTVIELMVAVLILAMVTAYAFPGMRSFMQRNRVSAQTNNIMATMQFARGQAAITRGYVSVCPLSAAGTTVCDTGGSYANGWMIFTTTTPGAVYSGNTTTLLRVESAPGAVSINASAVGILSFDSRGQLWVGSTLATGNTLFNVCALNSSSVGESTSLAPGVQLQVSSSGRVANGGQIAAGGSCD